MQKNDRPMQRRIGYRGEGKKKGACGKQEESKCTRYCFDRRRTGGIAGVLWLYPATVFW
jgi:hypothetical protein